MLPKIYINKKPEGNFLYYNIENIDIENLLRYRGNKEILIEIDKNIKTDKLLKILEDLNNVNIYFKYDIELPNTIKSRAIIERNYKMVSIVKDAVNINKLGLYYSYVKENNNKESWSYVYKIAKGQFWKDNKEILRITNKFGYEFMWLYLFLFTGLRIDVDIYKYKNGFTDQKSIINRDWIIRKMDLYSIIDIVYYLQRKLCYVKSSKIKYKLSDIYMIFNKFNGSEQSAYKIIDILVYYLEEQNKNNIIIKR